MIIYKAELDVNHLNGCMNSLSDVVFRRFVEWLFDKYIYYFLIDRINKQLLQSIVIVFLHFYET